MTFETQAAADTGARVAARATRVTDKECTWILMS